MIMYLNELVVNYHVTEACNFKCQHCFAKWPSNKSSAQRDKILSIVSRICDFLQRGEMCSPDGRIVRWKSGRITIAGGEPLLVKSVFEALNYIRGRRVRTSIVTNGVLLTDNLIDKYATDIDVIGISFDSIYPDTHVKIGRADSEGSTLTADRLTKMISRIRLASQAAFVKINTVVTRLNYMENMSDVINTAAPDRWKIIRVLPVYGGDTVSDAEFGNFIATHVGVQHLHFEDNKDMMSSYIMINPDGRIFQNKELISDVGYVYSEEITQIGVESAIKQVGFLPDVFAGRYPSSS